MDTLNELGINYAKPLIGDNVRSINTSRQGKVVALCKDKSTAVVKWVEGGIQNISLANLIKTGKDTITNSSDFSVFKNNLDNPYTNMNDRVKSFLQEKEDIVGMPKKEEALESNDDVNYASLTSILDLIKTATHSNIERYANPSELKTKEDFVWDRSFSPTGPITIPAGAPVEELKGSFWVKPEFFKDNSIFVHDATTHGCKVDPSNVYADEKDVYASKQVFAQNGNFQIVGPNYHPELGFGEVETLGSINISPEYIDDQGDYLASEVYKFINQKFELPINHEGFSISSDNNQFTITFTKKYSGNPVTYFLLYKG